MHTTQNKVILVNVCFMCEAACIPLRLRAAALFTLELSDAFNDCVSSCVAFTLAMGRLHSGIKMEKVKKKLNKLQSTDKELAKKM